MFIFLEDLDSLALCTGIMTKFNTKGFQTINNILKFTFCKYRMGKSFFFFLIKTMY